MRCRCGLRIVLGLLAVVAYGAEADAVAISSQIQTRHLPFGTILDPFYVSSTSDQITGYTRCGDSALWTGHYLAAEAYRYRVTGSAEALNNARGAVAGLQSLVDVTGTNLLARCRFPSASPFAAGIRSEEAANGVYTKGADNWIGNTSRDQYCGAIYGLGTAYTLIPDTALQATIRDVVTRMVDFLLFNAWSAPMPDGRAGTTFLLRPDEQLAILQVARRVNPTRFASEYANLRGRLADSVAVPVAFDSLSTSSYFKFNLIYITFFSLIGLEEENSRTPYERAYTIARAATVSHQNAFFNMIDAALYGPDPRRDAETVALLDLWLKRPRRDFYVDLRGKVNVCGDQACDPIPVDLRTPTDFLWQRSPFQLSGGGSGTIGNAGVDYILPYWMARYYGVIRDFQVQSAAAPIGSVAPDSLASLYGASLARQTVAASGLPTETLGDIRVRVTDSAGTSRLASLIYVSPAQINFLVPAGTAPGVATFGVLQADGAQRTASWNVQSVAPALFTMNQRIAAATAIRVQNGVQSGVPLFNCTTGGCSAIPIDLSDTAPIYVELYGTGLRRATSASATVRGTTVPVLYAGAQSSFPGLDQVNITLPASLRGAGEVEIVVTVDGQRTNRVYLTIR